MPIVEDPTAVLEKQVPMYHLDDENRYLIIMGVGPEGSDGQYTGCDEPWPSTRGRVVAGSSRSRSRSSRSPGARHTQRASNRVDENQPRRYEYDILDVKHIIQAQLGFDPNDINIRAGGDFRPDECVLE